MAVVRLVAREALHAVEDGIGNIRLGHQGKRFLGVHYLWGGLSAWGHHIDTMPDLIANGCDMILFSDVPEEDMAAVKAALKLTQRQLLD